MLNTLGQIRSNFSTEEHIILLSQARDPRIYIRADFLFLSGTHLVFGSKAVRVFKSIVDLNGSLHRLFNLDERKHRNS